MTLLALTVNLMIVLLFKELFYRTKSFFQRPIIILVYLLNRYNLSAKGPKSVLLLNRNVFYVKIYYGNREYLSKHYLKGQMNCIKNTLDISSNDGGKKLHKSGLAHKIIMLSLPTIILLAVIVTAAWLLRERWTMLQAIGCLQTEKQKLNENLSLEQKKARMLADEFETRNNAFASRNAELSSENQELVSQIETLENHLETLTSQAEALTVGNQTITEENQKLTEKIEILNDQIGKAAREYRIRMEQFAAENNRLAAENASLAEKITQLANENIMLSEENKILTKEKENDFIKSLGQKAFLMDDANKPNS
jgi:uncharacterized protein YeeX (DUF496 family)